MDQHEQRLTDTHTHVLALEVVGRSTEKLEAEVAFEYSACDPYAVTLLFSTVAGPIRWAMARDLLAEGLVDPVGDGDVHVWPSLDHEGRAILLLELCGPDGSSILLQARARQIMAFLEVTYAVVEPGAEGALLDLDAVIEDIFASSPAQPG